MVVFEFKVLVKVMAYRLANVFGAFITLIQLDVFSFHVCALNLFKISSSYLA